MHTCEVVKADDKEAVPEDYEGRSKGDEGDLARKLTHNTGLGKLD
jgi:hypothetical protein